MENALLKAIFEIAEGEANNLVEIEAVWERANIAEAMGDEVGRSLGEAGLIEITDGYYMLTHEGAAVARRLQ